eukprot:TRINITY_DN20546_c0_g1_i2.p1 TRINITY_DN20546_c0_g1~~TRINITY_DN20546_c0_g1_i2.p1  ORF type:complete len:127 (+),score=30.46 TRINITY_DN20546_c0_g1_i2:273-653(+)
MKNLQAVENAAKEVTNSDTFKSTRRRQSAKWGSNDPETQDQQISAAAFEGSLALASSFAAPSPTSTGSVRDADAIDFGDLRMRSILYLLRPFLDCLLYTSDAADEEDSVDLGGGRVIEKKKNVQKK